ncbi:hypothetical protein D3C72_2170310 [compost metagenome]
MEKKSAAFTRFWVFAYSEIFGTTVSPSSPSITDSFICTKMSDSFALSLRRVWNRDAVVWPPLTICRSTMRLIDRPSSPRVVSTLLAVAVIPLL